LSIKLKVDARAVPRFGKRLSLFLSLPFSYWLFFATLR